LHSPNREFFKVYGTLDNPDSRLSYSQFIFIRHGQTKANVFSKQLGLFQRSKDGRANVITLQDDALEQYWNI